MWKKRENEWILIGPVPLFCCRDVSMHEKKKAVQLWRHWECEVSDRWRQKLIPKNKQSVPALGSVAIIFVFFDINRANRWKKIIANYIGLFSLPSHFLDIECRLLNQRNHFIHKNETKTFHQCVSHTWTKIAEDSPKLTERVISLISFLVWNWIETQEELVVSLCNFI